MRALSPQIERLAKKCSKTNAQIFFNFVHSLGITVLTGTTSIEHMEQDLEALNIQLDPSEIASIQALLLP
jgi:diketogulonate reductase-like aldo/keto reductase